MDFVGTVIFGIVENPWAAEQLAERNDFFGDQFRSDLCKAKTRLRLQNEVCCLAESRIVKRKTVLVKKGKGYRDSDCEEFRKRGLSLFFFRAFPGIPRALW